MKRVLSLVAVSFVLTLVIPSESRVEVGETPGVVSTVVDLLTPTRLLAAQHEEHEGDGNGNLCWYRVYSCTVNDSEGDWVSTPFGGASPTHRASPTFVHLDCLICRSTDGAFGICHYGCEEEQEEQQEELATAPLQAYVNLMQAFEVGDLDTVIEVVTERGLPVYLNRERAAIQLLHCDGEQVVASLGLSGSEVTSLAALVPNWENLIPVAGASEVASAPRSGS
jgi:hypothetical protein